MADSDLQSTEERQVTKPPKLLGGCTSAARGRFGAVGEAVLKECGWESFLLPALCITCLRQSPGRKCSWGPHKIALLLSEFGLVDQT